MVYYNGKVGGRATEKRPIRRADRRFGSDTPPPRSARPAPSDRPLESLRPTRGGALFRSFLSSHTSPMCYILSEDRSQPAGAVATGVRGLPRSGLRMQRGEDEA